jgi:hypothetical protein
MKNENFKMGVGVGIRPIESLKKGSLRINREESWDRNGRLNIPDKLHFLLHFRLLNSLLYADR